MTWAPVLDDAGRRRGWVGAGPFGEIIARDALGQPLRPPTTFFGQADPHALPPAPLVFGSLEEARAAVLAWRPCQ